MEDQRRETVKRKVLNHILSEIRYQEGRWGRDHDIVHTPREWVIIVTKYLGKAAQESERNDPSRKSGFRKRLVQIAAICISALIASMEDDEEWEDLIKGR